MQPRRDCCHDGGYHLQGMDNCGISAQQTDCIGRPWVMCPLLRIKWPPTAQRDIERGVSSDRCQAARGRTCAEVHCRRSAIVPSTSRSCHLCGCSPRAAHGDQQSGRSPAQSDGYAGLCVNQASSCRSSLSPVPHTCHTPGASTVSSGNSRAQRPSHQRIRKCCSVPFRLPIFQAGAALVPSEHPRA